MMDVSDGLAKDLRSLTPAGLAPALEAAAIPRRRGATLAAAVAEGEDYELVFAVSREADRAEFERAWRWVFRTRLTCIGRWVRAGERKPEWLDLEAYHGYEHLSGETAAAGGAEKRARR